MTTAKADTKTTHTKTYMYGDKKEHEHITTNEREYEYEYEGVLCHTKPCAKERRKRCMHHGDVAAQPLCGSWRCNGAFPLSLIPFGHMRHSPLNPSLELEEVRLEEVLEDLHREGATIHVLEPQGVDVTLPLSRRPRT